MHPDILKYWEEEMDTKKCMTKMVKDEDNVLWTPLEAYEEGNNKKYPVLFIFGGSNNDTFMTETYGYAQLAAQEGLLLFLHGLTIRILIHWRWTWIGLWKN